MNEYGEPLDYDYDPRVNIVGAPEVEWLEAPYEDLSRCVTETREERWRELYGEHLQTLLTNSCSSLVFVRHCRGPYLYRRYPGRTPPEADVYCVDAGSSREKPSPRLLPCIRGSSWTGISVGRPAPEVSPSPRRSTRATSSRSRDPTNPHRRRAARRHRSGPGIHRPDGDSSVDPHAPRDVGCRRDCTDRATNSRQGSHTRLTTHVPVWSGTGSCVIQTGSRSQVATRGASSSWDAAQTGRYEVEVSCRDCYEGPPCDWHLRADHARHGSLRENESASIPLRLRAGVFYRLVGDCDWDCTDLDLRVRGPDRETVAEDVEPGTMSVVDVQPQEGGISRWWSKWSGAWRSRANGGWSC